LRSCLCNVASFGSPVVSCFSGSNVTFYDFIVRVRSHLCFFLLSCSSSFLTLTLFLSIFLSFQASFMLLEILSLLLFSPGRFSSRLPSAKKDKTELRQN
jgi:hypothetical protein